MCVSLHLFCKKFRFIHPVFEICVVNTFIYHLTTILVVVTWFYSFLETFEEAKNFQGFMVFAIQVAVRTHKELEESNIQDVLIKINP